MEIGTKVKHIVSGKIGTIINRPTEFDDNYISVLWDGYGDWPPGYITRIKDLEPA